MKMVADEKGEDRLKAVSFAAGTAAFIACIERAFMVSVFMHWRVWAFLALNLLLLAILFTSKSQEIQSNQIQCRNAADAEFKKSKKRREHSQVLVAAVETAEPTAAVVAPAAETGNCVESGEIEEKLEDYDKLSEDELKKKVEDFIAMFRQHLICDAKGTKIMGCNTTNAITPHVY